MHGRRFGERNVIEEAFTEEERRRLLLLCMRAVPAQGGDNVLISIIAKEVGVDTVLVARRAYPAHLPHSTANAPQQRR
jgi:hypothetical protein